MKLAKATINMENSNTQIHYGSQLSSQMKITYNKEKHHKCHLCGKAFPQAGKLRKHINTVHNGQKDHKCDSCEKTFSQAGGHLKNHINSVHNGKKITNVILVEKHFLKQDT